MRCENVNKLYRNLGVRLRLDLWFWHSPLGPSVIPLPLPSPSVPTPPTLAKSLPQPGSQDPQLNYSRPTGSKGSWPSDAIIRTIQSHDPLMIMRLMRRTGFFLSLRLSFFINLSLSRVPLFLCWSSFFPTHVVTLMFWGAEGSTDVIWEVLRDMSS